MKSIQRSIIIYYCIKYAFVLALVIVVCHDEVVFVQGRQLVPATTAEVEAETNGKHDSGAAASSRNGGGVHPKRSGNSPRGEGHSVVHVRME